MTWIKINEGSPDYINLDQLYKIEAHAPSNTLTFWDTNAVLPKSYVFANTDDFTAFLGKLEKIIGTIEIDSLAHQG